MRFTPLHRVVARLRAVGLTRPAVAQATGLSVWHVSRITGMPEAKVEMERTAEQLGAAIVELALARLLSPTDSGRRP